jgi:hypothetical protein
MDAFIMLRALTYISAVAWAILPNIAEAKPNRANQITIRYVPPKELALQPIYIYVKEAHALEQIEALLRPLKLPRKLPIEATSCEGESNAWYEDNKVTICYEFLDDIWKNSSEVTTAAGVAPIDTLVGPFVDVVLHEVGHAVFDLLEIPIFGRQEDAADQFSVYLMLRFKKDEARRLILGNAYQYRADIQGHKLPLSLKHFADEHGTPAQRFFNVLCLAYGSDKKLFADFVDKGYLPKERAEGCEDEHNELAFTFNKLIRPHLDEKVAVKAYSSRLPPIDKRPARRPATQ